MNKQTEELSNKIFTLINEAQGSGKPEHHPNITTYKVLQACKDMGMVFAEDVGSTIYERASDKVALSQCILIPIDLEEAQ